MGRVIAPRVFRRSALVDDFWSEAERPFMAALCLTAIGGTQPITAGRAV